MRERGLDTLFHNANWNVFVRLVIGVKRVGIGVLKRAGLGHVVKYELNVPAIPPQ